MGAIHPRAELLSYVALAQIRRAMEQQVPAALVVADSAYGNDTQFREGVTTRRTAFSEYSLEKVAA